MDPYVRRVYYIVVGVLVALWCGMFAWAFQVLKPDFISLVSVPSPTFRDNLQDLTPFLRVPGIRFSVYHTVPGDTFSVLSQKFHLSEHTLRSLNQANDSTEPNTDAPILIPSKDGIFHIVRSGQGLSDIARAYSISLGDVLKANRITDDSKLHPGKILFLPNASYLTQRDVKWLALASLATQKGFLKPTTGRFADGFGNRIHPFTHKIVFHEGLDLAPGWGSKVVASQDGCVTFVGIKAKYGRLIILDHGAGLTSRYAHLDEILVKSGQQVKRGELIGKVGNTGRVTGPHLHFEIRLNGIPQNPLLYLVQ